MTVLGFIGTGGMGQGMAGNLIKAGYELIVNDLDRTRCASLEAQGAKFGKNPKEIAENSEIVFSMLPNNEAARTVSCGDGGLIEASSGARAWIDFSSIDKATILSAEEQLTAKGWTLVDAAAGGVEEVAAAGQLQIWASGKRDAFENYQGFINPMARSVMYVGELGNAKLVKNAMAMLAAVNHMALLEIFSWLRKGGLDAPTFEKIMADSMWDCSATQNIMGKVVSGDYKPRKSWMPKDVGFGLDIAREMEVPMPFVSLASQIFAIAQATGHDGWEATGIAANVYNALNGMKN
jgi:3-hydroxyisobutyrate dehydrogenase-like beta-hydroxyacid dehydrogenase